MPEKSRQAALDSWNKKYREHLAQKGLKSTMQRDIIANEFFGSNGHLTAEELYSKLRKRHSSIGLATVYRTLKILAAAGLAKERRFNDGFVRYEFAGPEEPRHDHIVCVECGAVEEFDSAQMEDVWRKIAAQRKFRIVDHRLDIYGVCQACSAKQGK